MTPQVQDKKRSQIAESFQDHVEILGYNKTSVDEIASALKISKKTIYQIFTSKQEIFDYIIDMRSGSFRNEIEELLGYQNTHRQKLNLMVKLFLTHRAEWNQELKTIKTKHKSEVAREAFNRAFFTILNELVKDGLKRNIYTSKDVSLTMEFIRSILFCAESHVELDSDIKLERETVSAINRLLNY